MNDLTTQDWYKNLTDECKDIITEFVFTSRWALIEGYWQVGRTVAEYALTRQEIYGEKIVQRLAESIGISSRTLNYAIATYKKYPEIDKLPEGKNISWNKLITKYLTEPKGDKALEECNHTWVCTKCGQKRG